VLEAMASGVAVVAPLEGGAKEFLVHEKNGLLVDTRDEAACHNAARRLVTDHELRHRLQREAVPAVAGFYPELPARKLLDVLFAEENA
jgi:D-inositol-3-phosphate glycosyltransferase